MVMFAVVEMQIRKKSFLNKQNVFPSTVKQLKDGRIKYSYTNEFK